MDFRKPAEDSASETQSFPTVHKPCDLGDKVAMKLLTPIAEVIDYISPLSIVYQKTEE